MGLSGLLVTNKPQLHARALSRVCKLLCLLCLPGPLAIAAGHWPPVVVRCTSACCS